MPQSPSELPSEIDRVTVHAADALVRRVASVAGQALPAVVRLGPLPLTIRPDTVRAVVVDAAGALEPVSATVRLTVEPAGEDAAAVSTVEREVRDAERAVDAAAAEVERLRDELAALRDHLGPVARERSRNGAAELVLADRTSVAPERRLALLRFADDEAALLTPQLVDAERNQQTAQAALAEAIDRRRAAGHEASRRHQLVAFAVVSLQGTGVAGAGARLEVSYLVAGATWRPTHRLRLDGDRSRFTLGAIVLQQTGEDWSGVQLELATREPRSHWELPELLPLRIGRAVPARTGWRPPEPVPDGLFADFDRARRAVDAARAEQMAAAPAPGSAEVPFAVATPPPLPPATPLPPSPPPVMAAAPPSEMAAAPMPQATRSAAARGGAPAQLVSTAAPEPPMDPDRPAQAVADLDRLDLPAALGAERGRPRPSRPAGAMAEAVDTARRGAIGDLATSDLGDATRFADVSCVYRVPGRVDLPAGRSVTNVTVGDEPLLTTDEFVVVPHRSTDVFRTVLFTNPFSSPIVAGPVDVVGPDGYLGPAEIETVPAGGRARLGVGIEDAISVERQVDHRDDAKGLRRNTRALGHQVQVRVTNRRAVVSTVVVRERVPIPPEGDDRLSVEEVAVEPPWQPFERADAILRGGRQWSVAIEPATSVDLRAAWTITIPAKHELDGGNRR